MVVVVVVVTYTTHAGKLHELLRKLLHHKPTIWASYVTAHI